VIRHWPSLDLVTVVGFSLALRDLVAEVTVK
jgi:hypothetical protein